MALNRWLSAALVVSVLGFAGCAEPQKKNPSASASPAATAAPAEVAETPDEPEMADKTPDMAEKTPSEAAATPADGGEVAAGGDAQDEDFENADGMEGYEEVLAMTVPASSAEVIAKGQTVFAENCASCHGEKGMGDGAAGEALDPKPRNLTVADEYKYGMMEKAIYRTGYYGVDGTGMAPLGDVVGEEDMWAVTHYIRTLQK